MIHGKAMITVRRVNDENKWTDYEWSSNIYQLRNGRGTSEDAVYAGYCCANESFHCMVTGCHAYPLAVDKMELGDHLVIRVHFEIQYYQYHEGDWDEDLVFTKEKVLKRRLNKNRKHSMLYDTLIRKIDRFIIFNPDHPGSQTVAALAKATRKDVSDYLLSLDVRDIGKLRHIIADAFPRVLRQVPLVGEKNIHGAWRVAPMLRNGKPFGHDVAKREML